MYQKKWNTPTLAVLSAGDVLYFTRRNGPRAAVGVRNLYVSMSRRDSVAVAREIMFHSEVFLALLTGESWNRAYKEIQVYR